MTDVKQTIETIFFAMGTVCRITVFDEADRAAAEQARRRVSELHDILSAYDESSEISAVNRNAGKGFTAVSKETYVLIRRSIFFSEATGGLFDITSTPLSLLWKESIKNGTLPDETAVKNAKALVNYRDIVFENNAVMLRIPGQKTDLGAVAKGYVADEVRRMLTENGVNDAIINLGGTVIVMGKPHTVGIQDPFKKTGTPFASVELHNKSVVSSGAYEQGFKKNGRIYHHIVDPATGYPSNSDIVGVTLIGDEAETLDAICTSAMLMSGEQAGIFLKRYPVEAVIIKKDGSVYVTDALKNKLKWRHNNE